MHKQIRCTRDKFTLKLVTIAAFFLVFTTGLFTRAPFPETGYAALSGEADRTAPQIESFTINYGDLITDRHEVTYQLEARDSVTAVAKLQIRLSDDAAAWSEWAPYRPGGERLLEGGAGTRFLYLEVRDEAGNVARASAAITVYVPVAGVSLSPETLLLAAGGAPAMLSAGVTPGSASHRTVAWRSDNTAVARVDDDGMVTPGEPGRAVITATTVEGGFSAACAVEVRPAAALFNAAVSDLYGDLDGDGTVNVTDAAIILRHVTGQAPLEPAQLQLADVNSDGRVDVADAVVVLRYVVGLVNELPVEPGEPGTGEPPPGEEEPPPAEEDPDGAWMAPTAKLLNATYRVQAQGTVTCSTLNVRSGPGTGDEVIGTVNKDQTLTVLEIRPTGDSVNPLWYRIDYNGKKGWLCANYVALNSTLYGLDFAGSPVRLAPAPEGLPSGDYKIDEQYNFDLLEGKKRVPTGITFYFLKHNPYAILPLERPAPALVTASYLAGRVKQIRSDSPFAKTGTAAGFIEAQRVWGLNSLYLLAHAAMESAWGTSAIARDKNNILGFMAYDSSPYLSAATFKSTADCALYVGGYIRKEYLNEDGAYFNGRHLLGMNEKYATDPMWAIKIARLMQNLAAFSDDTPVEKDLPRGTTTASLNLRSGAGTGNPLVLTMPKGALLQVEGMTAVSGTPWFKVDYRGESGWCSGKRVALQSLPPGAIFYSNWYSMAVPDRVNVRREPAVTAAVVGKLDFADRFTVNAVEMARDSSGNWYPWYSVQSGGLSGWIRGDNALLDW